MPFAKRGDVVHSEATSGFNNQKKSLLINGLAALGDSHRPLHVFQGLQRCMYITAISWGPFWGTF